MTVVGVVAVPLGWGGVAGAPLVVVGVGGSAAAFAGAATAGSAAAFAGVVVAGSCLLCTGAAAAVDVLPGPERPAAPEGVIG